ncbi:MAG: YciI family protein [Planctomycetes bacterium]|nr:YciI family protein [Planctomycetota bacterium]MCB9904370.1 YciI family protein [Planctomycetota bacterium]
MRYMLMIYSNEADENAMSPQDLGALMEGYGTFTEELIGSGAMQGAERLQPIATATTIRVRNGKTVTTDGPFAETKEQIGGYYLIDAPDLDAAIAWAAKIPTAKYGSVEVRPIWEMDGEG